MTHEIQHSFRELLNKSGWLDPATNKIANEKVESMMLRIGYPDFILDAKKLDSCYKDVSASVFLLDFVLKERGWAGGPVLFFNIIERRSLRVISPNGALDPPSLRYHAPVVRHRIEKRNA